MSKFKRIADSKANIAEITRKIDVAEHTGSDDLFGLKKEFHETKLEMIRLIETKDKRNGMNFDELERLIDGMPNVPRYLVGIDPLDRALDGVESGTFVQLVGESGAGKTTLAVEIVTNVAMAGKSVLFSFEMGVKRTHNRLSRYMSSDTQRRNMITDCDTRDIDDLCNEIVLYAEDGARFFVIDSKMKIEVPGNIKDYEKAATISSRLSKLTQQHDIIIILINQMNDDDIKNKRLGIKHGGDQKYDADIALFYVKHEEETQWRRLVCTKNRTGEERLFNLELMLSNGRTVAAEKHVPVYEAAYNHGEMAVV